MLRSDLALNGGLQEKLDQQAIEGTDGLLTGNQFAKRECVDTANDLSALLVRPSCTAGLMVDTLAHRATFG